MRFTKIFILILFFVTLGACQMDKNKSGNSEFPGTPEGARALLTQFLQPDADRAALTKKLKPDSKDFQAVFIRSAWKRAMEGYRKPWAEGKIVVQRRPGQDELLIYSATAEELKKGTGEAQHFPGGYKTAAPFFRDGVRWYRFKFVEPGKTLGYAWDGLVYVNGHWVIFPKPWRVVVPSLD